jgi:hypothetical protein
MTALQALGLALGALGILAGVVAIALHRHADRITAVTGRLDQLVKVNADLRLANTQTDALPQRRPQPRQLDFETEFGAIVRGLRPDHNRES